MNGWHLGIAIGAVVVLVVVVVLLLLIAGARRVAEKAEAVVAALHDARDGTAALWQLGTTVKTAERIAESAADARRSLSSGGQP